jgi:hypothetical protein
VTDNPRVGCTAIGFLALVLLAACASTRPTRPELDAQALGRVEATLSVKVLSPESDDDYKGDEIVFAFDVAGPCPIVSLHYATGGWSSTLRHPPWIERVSRRKIGAWPGQYLSIDVVDDCGTSAGFATKTFTIECGPRADP